MRKFLDKKIFGVRVGRILAFIGCFSVSVILWLVVRYLDAGFNGVALATGVAGGLL